MESTEDDPEILKGSVMVLRGVSMDCVESKAKTAGKKLGILNKVKRYFTPEQLLTLYQAQVRSCMEYCSHLWDGSAKYQLDALDSVDRRARRLIGNNLVVSRLQSLEHRRKVACLAVFYKIHFGECAQELFDLVKPSPFTIELRGTERICTVTLLKYHQHVRSVLLLPF
ncbi:jg12875 [Pararge aegeria aegeria]|uniref:Jg12875 protein n=1 Tax=Pararge aegeria aegeria TaxID=348720 RepID=A0A8S4S1T6_9NEOP|nr:jg12875 [Pararge aegeria aegeria]